MSKERADRGAMLVAEYRAGSEPRRTFCERHGIKVTALDYYQRRENARGKKQRLLPVVLTPEAGQGRFCGISIVTGTGLRVEVGRGFDPELLLGVLGLLERA